MHQPASLDDALPPSSALCAALEPGVLLSASSSSSSSSLPPTPSLALARALKSERIIGDLPPLDARSGGPVEEFPLAATLLGGSVGGVVRRPLPRGDAGGGVARRAPVAVGSVDAATAAARDEMGRVAKADARCRAPPSPALLGPPSFLSFCVPPTRVVRRHASFPFPLDRVACDSRRAPRDTPVGRGGSLLRASLCARAGSLPSLVGALRRGAGGEAHGCVSCVWGSFFGCFLHAPAMRVPGSGVACVRQGALLVSCAAHV